ncbi:MAG TPA: hypothetical protein VK729_07285 [Silvibacterium sp.]|nr:hypothetical protein [Silvibacterium sp.]
MLDAVDVPDPDEDLEGAAEAGPEFDVVLEDDVDPPPSDEDAATPGFSEPLLDSAEFAAGFAPLPA